jgi:phage-related protein
MENLSPAAKDAINAFKDLGSELKDFQQSTQESLFKQFSGDIKGAVTNLLPLKAGVNGISSEFGKAASEGLKFAATKEALSSLTQVTGGVQAAVAGLAPAVRPVLKGFLDISAAVSTAFGAKLGSSIAQAGAQFGTFLSGLAASGRAVELVSKAVTVFKQLGSIASNVGGIISGVFKAANDVGGGLLNNLQQVTANFEKFVKSAQGQQAIGNIFSALATIAAQLSPILSALVTTIGSIAPALVPLFTTLGPAITGIITAIGPALGPIIVGVQALATGLAGAVTALGGSEAFKAFGTAIQAIAITIAPLLPVIGQLVGALVSALAPAVTAIAEAIGPVITVIANAFVPLIPTLTGVITTLVTALAPLALLIGQTLAQALIAAEPLFTAIATAFANLATSIAPLIVQITSGLIPIFAALAPAITQIVTAVVPLVSQFVDALLPALPPIVDAFLAVLNAVLPLVPVIAQLFTALAPVTELLISIIAPVIQFAAEILKWQTLNIVVPILELIVTGLTLLVQATVDTIAGVTAFVTSVIEFFANLGTTVPAFVSSMVESVKAFFIDLFVSATTNALNLVNTVVTFFSSLPGRARDAISSLGAFLSGVFNAAKSQVISIAVSLVSEAVSKVRALPGQARAALGGIGSVLVSAGSDMIRGFINGIRSAAGALVSAAKDVVGSAINAAKSVLHIGSPSRVFHEIGKFTGQGLVNGLTESKTVVAQASERLADAVTGAFSDTPAVTSSVLQVSAAVQSSDLNAVSKQVEAASKKLGKDSSVELFDAGVQASKGFVEGLKSQQTAIEDLMLTLAEGMADAIRKALGIKSPSRVFMRIGRYTMDGLEAGMANQIGSVRRTAVGAAEAITSPFGGPMSTSGFQAAGGGLGGRGGSSRSVVNNNTFHVSQVTDSETVVQQLVNRLATSATSL